MPDYESATEANKTMNIRTLVLAVPLNIADNIQR
jgi:hypothetical protein